MRLLNARRSAIVAVALSAAALGWVQAAAGGGGLSITPGILEHPARPGGIGAVKISNTTRGPMTVKLAVRPWVQALDGEVSPNRRTTLGKVRPNRSSFRLAGGATRTVRLSLSRRPAGRSLFGAIEVIGARRHRGGKGIEVAYRLITSLRLFPPSGAQVLSARAGRLIEHGTTRRGTLLLAVRNTGNTIIPIGATVRLSGRGHTLRNNAVPEAIIPGATVNLRLARLRGTLPPGRYNVSVRLSQGGHPIGTIKRRGVRLR